METRANHLLVGGFVLIVIAAAFGFVVWLAKVDIDREFAHYEVFFEESVAGLSVGGDVRFNGIPVGTVTEIEIDPDNPARVRVLVEVASGTPIRTDTKASLAFKGITGVSFVQLSGGSPEQPLLEAERDGEVPVIASVPSALHELFAGAPQLIDRVIILVDRLALLVNDENQARFASILANVDGIMSEFDERMPELERILVNVDQMSGDLRQASKDLAVLVENADATLAVARGTITTVDGLIENDIRLLVRDLRGAAGSIDKLSRELDGFLQDNKEPLDLFASQGLVEFTKFIEEARLLVASSSRLVDELQTDPAQFLFGGRKGGLEAK